MSRRTYTYEATVKISVRGANSAYVARRVAQLALLAIRDVEEEDFFGQVEAKVYGGTLRAAKPQGR